MNSLLEKANEERSLIGAEEDAPNEPIVQVVYPDGEGVGGTPVWHDYSARCRDERSLLFEASVAEVSAVDWRPDGLVEIGLHGHSSKYLASSVGRGTIHHEDEIQKGDIAALAGHYMIVAEYDDSSGG